jgi:acylpyruvate hydrolase
MRLVIYSREGQPRLGAILGDEVVALQGALRPDLDASADAEDGSQAHYSLPPEMVDLLRCGEEPLSKANATLTFLPNGTPRSARDDSLSSISGFELHAPVRRPGKVICVGLNYRSHLAEIGEPPPMHPILFTKVATSLIGHGQAIVVPRISQQVDYEGELAVVIGRRGKYIPEQEALSYVAGYTCANDVSAHDIEFRTSQWTSGKILDTFCPLGPALVTRDEIADPGNLRLRTFLNGQTVQESYTSDMVFSVPALISYISSLATLEPGDVILTGTPAGIGCNRNPQRFLQAGDQVSVQIDGIGTLVNPVVSESMS